MAQLSQGARQVAAGLALCVALGPGAAWAAERPAPAAQKSLHASVAPAVARLNLAAAATQDPAAASTSGKSFFGSTKGKVAIALLAGAIVVTAVSRSKDAIHSPAK